ncbi:glycosyltransferase [Clostridium thermarum]|uniref:glycosyltransferase n=1 Tax=Clostridium thermarum TaxID=1716543 RepID=UPI001124B580|nr:glycosyltransferase [Clostridium thermarum]
MFLIESLVVGGAEKVLIDLVNNLDKSKYDITVISIYNNSIYKDYQIQFKNLFSSHIKYTFLCDTANEQRYKMFNRLLNRLPAKIFYKLYIKGKYDIEVAFSEGLPTKVITGSNNKASLKYAWLHTDTSNLLKEINKGQIESLKRTYLKYDRLIAVSKSVASSFKKEMNISIPVNVLYNPIDQNSIISKSKEQIEDITKYKSFTIVSVGRLVKVKGYDRLLGTAKRLRDEGLLFKMWIIGEGEERANLEQYILNNNLLECVSLLGFKSNPYKYIRQADLFVCSSRAEGLSTVVTEALILGKPVVATDCAGMLELLGENEYGIITENSEEGLYRALKSLLLNKERYNHYKKQAIIRGNYFSMDRLIAAMEEAL